MILKEGGKGDFLRGRGGRIIKSGEGVVKDRFKMKI